MPENKEPLSQVVPVLVAALVCDTACVDPTTGKHSLIGIFSHVRVQRFPTRRPFSLYMKVSDAMGFYEVDVRFVRVATGEVLVGAKGEMKNDDRSKSLDLHIAFPPLTIPAEGRYEFQVWANSMYLGSACLDAVQLKQPPREEAQ